MSESRRRVIRAWLPAVAYMLLIWVASSVPTTLDLRVVPFQDKGVHFVEYGVLSLLLSNALYGTWPDVSAPRQAFFAVLGTLLWGMLDEIHQAYVPGRNADIMDVWADGVGALCGTAVFWGYKSFKRSRENPSPRN